MFGGLLYHRRDEESFWHLARLTLGFERCHLHHSEEWVHTVVLTMGFAVAHGQLGHCSAIHEQSRVRNPRCHKHRQRADPTTHNKHVRSNSDRRVDKQTAEGLKTCQTHQRVDVRNTDHKDVAVFRESSRIFTERVDVTENNIGQRRTTSQIMDDLCQKALHVIIAFGVIRGTKLDGTLSRSGETTAAPLSCLSAGVDPLTVAILTIARVHSHVSDIIRLNLVFVVKMRPLPLHQQMRPCLGQRRKQDLAKYFLQCSSHCKSKTTSKGVVSSDKEFLVNEEVRASRI